MKVSNLTSEKELRLWFLFLHHREVDVGLEREPRRGKAFDGLRLWDEICRLKADGR